MQPHHYLILCHMSIIARVKFSTIFLYLYLIHAFPAIRMLRPLQLSKPGINVALSGIHSHSLIFSLSAPLPGHNGPLDLSLFLSLTVSPTLTLSHTLSHLSLGSLLSMGIN